MSLSVTCIILKSRTSRNAGLSTNMNQFNQSQLQQRRSSVPPTGSSARDKQRRRKIIVEHPDTNEEMTVKSAFERDLLTREDAIQLFYQV